MPGNPARSNHSFQGWNTSRNGGGTAFTASTPITGDITVYAGWSFIGGTGGDDGSWNPPPTTTPPSSPSPSPSPSPNPNTNTPGEDDENDTNTGGVNPGGDSGNNSGGNNSPSNPSDSGNGSDSRPQPPITVGGGSLIANDEGNYILIDADGNPLGEWRWCDEEETWLFEEIATPLSALNIPIPRTGDMLKNVSGISIHVLLFALSFIFMLSAVAMYFSSKKAKYRGRYTRSR